MFDIISTQYAISTYPNLREGNPIMALVTSSFALFILVKALGVMFIAGIYRRLQHPESYIVKAGKATILMILLFVVTNNCIQIASAESGNIDLVNSQQFGRQIPYYASDATTNFTTIYMDYLNYNRIESVQINSTYIVFPEYYRSTTFTCAAPNSCEGYVYWDANFSRITYTFVSSAIVQQAVTLILTNTNYFSGVSLARRYNNYPANVYTSFASFGTPIIFAINNTFLPANLFITSFVSLQSMDSYVVSYPFPGVFRVNISKNPTIATLYEFLGSNSVYSKEPPPYNSNNITGAIFTYIDGIILNVTLSNGVYKRVIINTTNCPECGNIGAIPTVRTYPSTGANIYTDKSSYVVGDNINVEWFIAEDPYDNLLSSCELQINDAVTAPSIAQHDIYTIVNPSAGVYKLDIECGVFLNTLAGTKSVSLATESQSYISANTTVISGATFDVKYKFGLTPKVQGELNSIIIERLENGVFNSYKTVSLNNNNIVANTEYTTQLTVGTAGTYKLSLFALGYGIKAYTTLEAISGFIPPQFNLGMSYLTMNSAAILFYNDILDVDYGIASANYSNTSNQKYISIYNIDTGRYYVQHNKQFAYETLEQMGNFRTGISSSISEPVSCTNCYISSIAFVAGNNSVRLIERSPTGIETILAQSNFTVSKVSAEGYGLSVSPTTAKTKEQITITAYAPISGRIKVVWNSNTVRNQLLSNIVFNTSITYRDNYGFAGTYTYTLYDLNDVMKSRTNVYVTEAIPIVTPPAGTPSVVTDPSTQGTITQIDNIVGLMGFGINPISKFLFVVILTIGLFIVGMYYGKSGMIGLALSSLPYTFFAYISYVPKWTFIIYIILLIVIAKVFR
jgi:hypothetical protein